MIDGLKILVWAAILVGCVACPMALGYLILEWNPNVAVDPVEDFWMCWRTGIVAQCLVSLIVYCVWMKKQEK